MKNNNYQYLPLNLYNPFYITYVSLNGELSKFIFPGDVVNKKPKSICNKCPS